MFQKWKDKINALPNPQKTQLTTEITELEQALKDPLLSVFIDTNKHQDAEDQYLFLLAAQSSANALLTFLIEAMKQDENWSVDYAKDFANRTALFWAVQGGNLEGMKLLVAQGADINHRPGRFNIHQHHQMDNPGSLDELAAVFLELDPTLQSGDIKSVIDFTKAKPHVFFDPERKEKSLKVMEEIEKLILPFFDASIKNPEPLEEPVEESEAAKVANDLRDAAKQLFQQAEKLPVRKDNLSVRLDLYLEAINNLLAIPEEDRIDEDYYLLSDYYYAVKWPYNDMGNDAMRDEMHQLFMSYPTRLTSQIAYDRCHDTAQKIKNNWWISDDDVLKLKESIDKLLESLGKYHTDNDCRALIRCYKTLGDLGEYAAKPENAEKLSAKELKSLVGQQGYYFFQASEQMGLIVRPTDLDKATHKECAAKANIEEKIFTLSEKPIPNEEDLFNQPPLKKQRRNSSSSSVASHPFWVRENQGGDLEKPTGSPTFARK